MRLSPYGALVRKYRLDRNMRQTEMAGRLELSQAYLSGIETGRKPVPRGDFLNRVAHILHLSTEEFEAMVIAAGECTTDVRAEMAIQHYKDLAAHWRAKAEAIHGVHGG